MSSKTYVNLPKVNGTSDRRIDGSMDNMWDEVNKNGGDW